MRVHEIRIDGGDDAVKERVVRMLCPVEDHPSPCPVPWSAGFSEEAVVVAICADSKTAVATAERVRALTPLPVTLTEVDPADHPTLVEQYRIERALHQKGEPGC